MAGPYPHPPIFLFLFYFIHTGRWGGGGRVEPERRGNSSQSWVENTNITDDLTESPVYSINSDKHLPQSPFTRQLFNMTPQFCFDIYIVN